MCVQFHCGNDKQKTTHTYTYVVVYMITKSHNSVNYRCNEYNNCLVIQFIVLAVSPGIHTFSLYKVLKWESGNS